MISVSEAVYVQKSLAERAGTQVGIRDPEALMSALTRAHATRQGLPVFPSLFGKVGVTMEELVVKKPFRSQNRRTALAVVLLILHRHDYAFETDPTKLDTFFNAIDVGFTKWQRIMRWVKAGARKTRFPAGNL